MYDHILVPTDGSEEAREAADYAIELASHFDATVHALYIVEPATITLPSEAMRHEEVRDEYRAWGEEVTTDVVDRAAEHGLDGVKTVSEGPPHEEINRYAAENGVDLVVMGTAGQTGLRERLLGSVTEKTARVSDVPILIVRDGKRTKR